MEFYKVLILAVIFGILFAGVKYLLSLAVEAIQRKRS